MKLNKFIQADQLPGRRRFAQRRRIAASIMILVLIILPPPFAFGAGSHLDYDFGGDGMVTTNNTGSSNEEGLAVAIQPLDQKIVVAGITNAGTGHPVVYDWLIARYNTNGTLDTTFGSNGKVAIDFGGDNDVPAAVAAQSNGNIVIAGKARMSGQYDFAVARLTSSGDLDTAFGGDGKVAINFGGADEGHGLAIQSDSKVVIAGSALIAAGTSRFALARLTANGGLDTTFAGDGKLTTYFGYQQKAGAYDVTMQPDGKIVACGFASPMYQTMVIARFTATGSFDTTFNFMGWNAQIGGGNDTTATTIRRLSSGKLVIAGYTHGEAPGADLLVLRVGFLPSGELDPDDPGPIGFPLFIGNTRFDRLGGALITAAGEIYATGYASAPGPKYFVISRYVDQYFDPLFGTGGHIFTYFGVNNASAHGLALQKNGRVVVAGAAANSSGNADFALARYKRKSLAVRGDFAGAGYPDYGVYRPANSTWNFEFSGITIPWGASGDIPVPGDFDGDSTSDAAVFRPSTATWYVLRSSNQATMTVPLGTAADLPAQGDYDGDGFTDCAVFQPATGAWQIRRSTAGQTTVFFGTASDKPVQADYDGDGLADVAVFTPSTGTWKLLRSRLGATAIQFGLNGDRPVPGDYDGDGMDDVAVFRPSDGTWYILNSGDGSVTAMQWGQAGDIPAPADFSSDGLFDLVVFRPAEGNWYIKYSFGGTGTQSFGQFGDVPITSAYNPQ